MGVKISKDWFTVEAQKVPARMRKVALFEQQKITKSEQLPELMNARDVAKKLRIHEVTAALWLKSQRIRSTKIEGRRFTTPEWIADYLNVKSDHQLNG